MRRPVSKMALKKKRGLKKVRRKIDRFKESGQRFIDYKDEKKLIRFMTEVGKIIPRKISGNSASTQRKLTLAIKRARHLGLLPFVSDNTH